MMKIGVTGGIGSGKTTVCRIFETLGVPVFYADERARQLMENDQQLINAIKETFGVQIYKGNIPDRQHIAEMVFNDPSLLEKLNALVHPAVAKDFDDWLDKISAQSYVINEAAIIFEAGTDKLLDKVISVNAPQEVRIQRIIDRDKTSEEKVKSRIKQQLSDEERSKLADFIILNDGKTKLINQVIDLHEELVLLSNSYE
ncbi:MAG: dephospho-CoA kinase [Bacteroidetes bacterium]|nr:dephospho-CoA kinase [Bacteroidota bacterium]